MAMILVAFLFSATGFVVGYAITQSSGEEDKPNYYANKITSPPVPKQVVFAGERVPVDTYWVHEGLDRELVINCYQHSKTLRILKLSARIFPVIEPILKEEGVPDDFKYLCVAESGLENVTSPAGANGYWQFIAATARKYGLEVTDAIDERCNLEKSTRAACRYLKSCKEQFGSWSLAAAAYNRGELGIRKAMDHQGEKTFWDLWLNNETSRYLYRILAFKLIFENPQQYGVDICPAEMYQPVPCKDVKVTQTIDLVEFAHNHKATYKEIRDLNPWIKDSKLTVTSGKTYILKVPESPKTSFKDLYSKIDNPFLKIADSR